METTFDVRIWNIEPRRGQRGIAYRLTWIVDGKAHKKTFRNSAMADSFRADLVAASRRGEAFDIDRGLPISVVRNENALPWFEFAQKYVDMKWKRAAAKTRADIADAMATVTVALLSTGKGKPSDQTLRRAMTGWAFNVNRRDTDAPADVKAALAWLTRSTVSVAKLDDVALVRACLEQLSLKLDGRQAAAKTVMRKRAVFFNALEYAVELKTLSKNRLPEVKWTAPKTVRAIDKRVVINHRQARSLLRSVEAQKVEGQPRRSAGPALSAMFAVMYYSALRPEEAVNLRKQDLNLPEKGWGELLLSETAPIAGAAWTDSGRRRDNRQLKQRAKGDVRSVPTPPQLTERLRTHLETFGTTSDGRLFRNLTGGEVSESTVSRVWNNARKAALTVDEYQSPLAKRPYDLRHAAVSTWLGSGVQSAQCAEWAGHSVTVLHQIYAKVIAGLEDEARRRIDATLNDDE
jgi:integrase